jgi:hypothetical protein
MHRIVGTLAFVLASVPALPQDNSVLLPIRENGRWGFIDGSAHVRIAPQFEDSIEINNTFDGDLEPVKKDGKWGFINRDGPGRFIWREK